MGYRASMRLVSLAAILAFWSLHSSEALACFPAPSRMVFPGGGEQVPANVRVIGWHAQSLPLGRLEHDAAGPRPVMVHREVFGDREDTVPSRLLQPGTYSLARSTFIVNGKVDHTAPRLFGVVGPTAHRRSAERLPRVSLHLVRYPSQRRLSCRGGRLDVNVWELRSRRTCNVLRTSHRRSNLPLQCRGALAAWALGVHGHRCGGKHLGCAGLARWSASLCHPRETRARRGRVRDRRLFHQRARFPQSTSAGSQFGTSRTHTAHCRSHCASAKCGTASRRVPQRSRLIASNTKRMWL